MPGGGLGLAQQPPLLSEFQGSAQQSQQGIWEWSGDSHPWMVTVTIATKPVVTLRVTEGETAEPESLRAKEAVEVI